MLTHIHTYTHTRKLCHHIFKESHGTQSAGLMLIPLGLSIYFFYLHNVHWFSRSLAFSLSTLLPYKHAVK
jgi:hypothetical protein